MTAKLTAWLTQILEWMSSYLGGFGTNISTFVKNLLFVVTTGTGGTETYELSVFAYVIGFFVAFALGRGLTKLLFGWIKSFGGR